MSDGNVAETSGQPKAAVVGAEAAGTVLEGLPSLLYRVRLDGGGVVSASVTGRHGLSFLRLLPGDRVRLRLAERDVTRARILKRMER